MRINPVVIVQRSANCPIGIIKFFQEVFRIGNGCLIGTAEVVVEHDNSCKGIVRIDAICRSSPTFNAHFPEIVIPEIIKEIQMLYPSVEAIPKIYTEMIIVFGDVQCTFPLFVLIALLIESLADTTLQNISVFQWSA